MGTFVALLRGINVSGQKKIKMADLRKHLEELEISAVQTYIQSGNIVFEATGFSEVELSEMIRKKIEEKYGFDVPTLVIKKQLLEQAISAHPYVAEAGEELKGIYVVFLYEKPTAERLAILLKEDLSPEAFHMDETLIYLYVPMGMGKAKMSNNYFEQKLKVPATTRNWKTVNILNEMCIPAE